MDTATYRIDGHTMYEHWLSVPLDYFSVISLLSPEQTSRMIPDRINVFAREYVRDGHEADPRLVFFQGGPGSAGPRMAPIGSWLDTALEHFRVVLIDERGTGNSHPLDAQALADRIDWWIEHPQERAEWSRIYAQHTEEHYSVRACVEKFVAMDREAIADLT